MLFSPEKFNKEEIEAYNRVVEMVVTYLDHSDIGDNIKEVDPRIRATKIFSRASVVLDRLIFGRKYKVPKAMTIYYEASDKITISPSIFLSVKDIEAIKEAYLFFSKTIKPIIESKAEIDKKTGQTITEAFTVLYAIRKAKRDLKRICTKGDYYVNTDNHSKD